MGKGRQEEEVEIRVSCQMWTMVTPLSLLNDYPLRFFFKNPSNTLSEFFCKFPSLSYTLWKSHISLSGTDLISRNPLCIFLLCLRQVVVSMPPRSWEGHGAGDVCVDAAPGAPLFHE